MGQADGSAVSGWGDVALLVAGGLLTQAGAFGSQILTARREAAARREESAIEHDRWIRDRRSTIYVEYSETIQHYIDWLKLRTQGNQETVLDDRSSQQLGKLVAEVTIFGSDDVQAVLGEMWPAVSECMTALRDRTLSDAKASFVAVQDVKSRLDRAMIQDVQQRPMPTKSSGR